MSYFIEIDDDIENIINNNTGLLLIDCFADWCVPCKTLMNQIDKQLTNPFVDIKLIKHDVTNDEQFKTKYSIKSVPTFILFEDDCMIGKTSTSNLQQLLQWIKQQ